MSIMDEREKTAMSLLEDLRRELTSLNIKYREVKYTSEYYNSHWEVRVGNQTVATVGRDSYGSKSPRQWYWRLESSCDVKAAVQHAIEAQKELKLHVKTVKALQLTQNVDFELAELAVKAAKTSAELSAEEIIGSFKKLPVIKSNKAAYNAAFDLIQGSNDEKLISSMGKMKLMELAPLGKFKRSK